MADTTHILSGNAIKLVDQGDSSFAIAAELTAGTALVGKVGIDQTTDGTTNKVQARNATHGDFQVNATIQVADVDASSAVPVPVRGDATAVSATFTRTADTEAYAALDVVGAAVTADIDFANVASANGSVCLIVGARLEIDIAAIPSGMDGFRLHLYNAAPTAIADNAAFDLPSGDRAKYLGYITLNAPVDLGATLWSNTDLAFAIKCGAATTTIYGMLQTLGAYTPSSADVFAITLYTSRM